MTKLGEGKRQLVLDWWTALQPAEDRPLDSEQQGRSRRFFFDRGDRARLRRCSALEDAVAQSAVWRLAEALEAGETDNQSVLLTACVLAQVKENAADGKSFIYALGEATTVKDEKPLLSELRFQRLMRSGDPDELLQQMRRVLSIGSGKADVGHLAEDLFAWMKERTYAGATSSGVKYRWARDYYLKRSDRAFAPPDHTSSFDPAHQ